MRAIYLVCVKRVRERVMEGQEMLMITMRLMMMADN